MDGIKPESKGLTLVVAKRVKEMIINSNLQPGTKLPSESELMNLFGMSRSTIREAMNLLKAENVIEIKRGKGTFVSKQPGMSQDPLGLDFVDQDGLLIDLLEARLVIEPEITFLAALKATDEELAVLEESLEKIEEMTVHSNEHTRLDIEFHTAIAKCTNNNVLHKVVPIICESITRSYPKTFSVPGGLERSLKSHRNIFDAIKNRDAGRARFEVEKHIRQTIDEVNGVEK